MGMLSRWRRRNATALFLQLNPCPFRQQLCGLFFNLFLATWQSAYKSPSPSGYCSLPHSSVALKPCKIKSLHFTSFEEELSCQREISVNLVQFTFEKLLLLLFFPFSTCLSICSLLFQILAYYWGDSNELPRLFFPSFNRGCYRRYPPIITCYLWVHRLLKILSTRLAISSARSWTIMRWTLSSHSSIANIHLHFYSYSWLPLSP